MNFPANISDFEVNYVTAIFSSWSYYINLKYGHLWGWTIRGSNSGGERFFAHVQTGPGAHPAFCKMGTGSFPGVKRPGRGADHPPPSSAEVENE
jgi:hypothetical protein